MNLDGFPIALNTQLYDVAFGTGVVTNINTTSNTFSVDFTVSGRSMVYSADNGNIPGGVNTRFAARSLFWQNPIIMPPPPATFVNSSGVSWTKIKSVLQSVFAAFA